MSRPRGFTLVELLVGLSILAVLLTAVLQWTQGNIRSYRAVSEMMQRNELESIARNVVIRELSLAGYGAGFIGELSGPVIEIGLAETPGESDTFRISYLEERWSDEPVRRQLTFDVRRDAHGQYNLYRREPGATRQPAVQEVTGLRLVSLVTPDGQLRSPTGPWPETITAFVVELSFSWESSRFAYVGFAAPQQLGRL